MCIRDRLMKESDPLGLGNVINPDTGKSLNELLPTLFNIDPLFAGDNAGSLARERAQTIVTSPKNSSAANPNAVLKVPRAERMADNTLKAMLNSCLLYTSPSPR